MAVTVEPVFPPQVLTWEELPLLTVEAELPHWEGKRAFCRYYAAWGRGLLDYGRRVLLPQLAERCRRALEQGGMLPLTVERRYAESHMICGDFSSRTESFPLTTTA